MLHFLRNSLLNDNIRLSTFVNAILLIYFLAIILKYLLIIEIEFILWLY